MLKTYYYPPPLTEDKFRAMVLRDHRTGVIGKIVDMRYVVSWSRTEIRKGVSLDCRICSVFQTAIIVR